MGEAKTQQPEGLTQQSNGPWASTGVALVDLALKKNAGRPGVEEEVGWQRSCWSAKNNAHHGGDRNSETGRTHATIKWSLVVYWCGSGGFGRQKECWGTRVEEVG